jgi:NaMN:DMB phosphoribosyltransferase
MAAVLALALAIAPAEGRPALLDLVQVATTAWVAQDSGSNLAMLLERIAGRWGLEQPLVPQVAGLRFCDCRSQALRDYERGYVKEGVGAGGLALLWERCGHSPQALASACDALCWQWLGA